MTIYEQYELYQYGARAKYATAYSKNALMYPLPSQEIEDKKRRKNL